MEKIGIITIPDYNNFGNRLQNYAVKTYFEKKGFKVDSLEMNDKDFPQRGERKIKLYLKKYHMTLIMFIYELLRKDAYCAFRYLKFEKFTRKYLNVRYVPQWEEEVSYKIGEQYKYIVLGSDQIWHPYVNTTPNLFFGKFVECQKRLYFSPSFGVQAISRSYSDIVKEGLKGVKNLSVREKTGKRLLEELTEANIKVLCDPTLLLTRDEWSKIAVKPKRIPNDYILSYFLGPTNEEYIAVSNEIKQSLHCEFYRIASKKDKKSICTGPGEFIYAIKNARYVITDSFHAVAFSLIFGKPFLVFSRLNENGKIAGLDSRVELLLSTFNMSDRKYSKKLDTKKTLLPLENITDVFLEHKNEVDSYFQNI